jgi:hypothetical protein
MSNEDEDEEGEDWEQDDLLAGANELNIKIKEYIDSHRNNQTTPARERLEEYKTNIMGYLVDIGSQEFSPRPDRLTKAGIEEDLRNNLRMINSALSRGTGNKRKRKHHSKKKKDKSRSKRSRRSSSSRSRSKRRRGH